MIAVIQRVNYSCVKVNNNTVGEINKGLNILLGINKGDTEDQIPKFVNKIVNLRIFEDENGKMNKSLLEINGQVLIISQFTLAGDIKKGRRPSFDNAEEPKKAEYLYSKVIEEFQKYVSVQTGVFGEYMEVIINNDGPVTFIVNSKELN